MNALESAMRNMKMRTRLDPSRDWYVLLSLGGVILAGLIGWNVWAFDTIASGGVIGSPVVAPDPIFSKDSIESIRDIFAERAAEEAKYQTGVYRYADPSQ